MPDAAPPDTTPAELEQLLDTAQAAWKPWRELSPETRGVCLGLMADHLDAAADELIPLAAAETQLGLDRLAGELRRTTFQLRLFTELLDDGSYLRATIDRPDPTWGPGPRPDLRRVLVALGPVVVFAASNFPFAFSVAGGDTASALAAGCPVVVKAHPGHPVLSARTAEILGGALSVAGAPAGLLSVIYGEDAGRQAVTSPVIRAGAFTGSLEAGRALFDLASSRSDPIPFYAEMGSLNPVFVTKAAFAERGSEIMAGFAGSFTLSGGQFCTKPGLLFLPSDAANDEELAEALTATNSPTPLLNRHVQQRFAERLESLRSHPAVHPVVGDAETETETPTPTVLVTTVPAFLTAGEDLLVECFGPAALVVRYRDEQELVQAAEAFGGQLTATVHGAETEAVVPILVDLLSDRAGRVLWNGWPTGVSVTAAMHHGGPYPATTSPLHTSVGTSAVDRFLRPVCYQSMPDALLPPALRDANPLRIRRTVNGQSEES